MNGLYPDWFERRGKEMGCLSGKLLLFVASVVFMMYVWIFQSLLLTMLMKPNMEKPIDTTKDPFNATKAMESTKSLHNS